MRHWGGSAARGPCAGGAAPLPGRCAAAATGIAPGQKRDRGSATRRLLRQEGRGQHRGRGAHRDTGRREPGRSPQRSQHCPSGRRASWQEAVGQRPPRGWSRAAQIHGCAWRVQAAVSAGGQAADAARGPRAPGASGPEAWAPDARSAAARTHFGVAADAARRVGADLGAQAQRPPPVEAQAAGAGRQESGQVLVARERLRVARSPDRPVRGGDI